MPSLLQVLRSSFRSWCFSEALCPLSCLLHPDNLIFKHWNFVSINRTPFLPFPHPILHCTSVWCCLPQVLYCSSVPSKSSWDLLIIMVEHVSKFPSLFRLNDIFVFLLHLLRVSYLHGTELVDKILKRMKYRNIPRGTQIFTCFILFINQPEKTAHTAEMASYLRPLAAPSENRISVPSTYTSGSQLPMWLTPGIITLFSVWLCTETHRHRDNWFFFFFKWQFGRNNQGGTSGGHWEVVGDW